MKNKKELRIGLIGYGFMGRTHSNGYKRVGDFFPELEYRPVLKSSVPAMRSVSKHLPSNGAMNPTKRIGKNSLHEMILMRLISVRPMICTRKLPLRQLRLAK